MNTRIAEIRKNANLTQEQFGQKMNISKNYVNLIENGRKNPSDRLISDICRVFDIDEKWLRTGNGEMQKPWTDRLGYVLGQIAGGDDDLIKDLILAYMELDNTSKQALRQIRDSMLAKQKEREQK